MENRPLTHEEKCFLKGYFGTSNVLMIGANVLFGFVILTSFAFVIAHGFFKHVAFPVFDMPYTPTHRYSIMLFSVAVIAVFFHGGVRKIFRFHLQGRQQLHDIFARNQAEVHTLHIRRAAELEEWGDEGVGFFLETDQNNVLFVRGQDLYDYASDCEEEEDEPRDRSYGVNFPSTRVMFIREPISGIRLGLRSDGEKIADTRILTGQNFIQKIGKEKKYIGPDDASFYPGSLDEVLRRFSIKAGK